MEHETNYKLKLREIYDSMPGQLDSKNKRFKINTLGKGLNYDRVANDFLWILKEGFFKVDYVKEIYSNYSSQT